MMARYFANLYGEGLPEKYFEPSTLGAATGWAEAQPLGYSRLVVMRGNFRHVATYDRVGGDFRRAF